MQAFFSPHSKRRVCKPLAYTLNTLNLLGPVLLFVALILLGVATFGDWLPEEDRLLVSAAGILIVASLTLRVIWGIGVARVRRAGSGVRDSAKQSQEDG